MRRRTGYNPKRQVAAAGASPEDWRKQMSAAARYGGKPEHKRLPGDFGLTPPSSPRPGKTLCDEAGVFEKAKAEQILHAGFAKGMVSVQQRNGWPQNVWSVVDGQAFEAQLENPESGTYHGYPMPLDDDFRAAILHAWGDR